MLDKLQAIVVLPNWISLPLGIRSTDMLDLVPRNVLFKGLESTRFFVLVNFSDRPKENHATATVT